MEWYKLLTLSGTFLLSYSKEMYKDGGIIFHYNNTYKYNVPYLVIINKNTEYIMEFAGKHSDIHNVNTRNKQQLILPVTRLHRDVQGYDTPARVTVASDLANKTYPVFITARQQKGVFSWQLPMVVQTPGRVEQFMNISRTLCPHNNMFDEGTDTCDVLNENTPIIHLTSSSPDDIEITILIETVEDFYVKLNTTTNLTSTPSQPKYYFYPLQQDPNSLVDIEAQNIKRKYICNEKLDTNEEEVLGSYMVKLGSVDRSFFYKIKSVIVIIESEDDICAVVSIQNFSCPVFDNERDILYDGYYLTMTRRGGITLTQDMFPLGFYIVFIVKSSDEACTEQTLMNNETLPSFAQYLGWSNKERYDVVTNDGRVKSFSFVIVETISYKEYLIAAGAALAFFLSFYLAVFVAIICQRWKKLHSVGDALTDSRESEEGRLTPPAVSTVPIERGAPQTAPSGEEGSVATTSRQNLIDNNEVVTSPLEVTDTNRTVHTANDSSSDSESEYSVQCDPSIDPRDDSYLLPSKLCVANLATKGPRVLSSRSKMYLWNVLTVAVFYTLPVIQLVVTYQRMLNQSGNQDLCYFNFLCAHPLMVLSDFNHVYSNLGYVLLGTLFLMQVWRRHRKHMAKTLEQRELGIPQHFGLLYAMGIALVGEGLLSAAYHVCPNSMNFQFDTSFMYVTSVLCMVKIYQSRHPDVNARAHATFLVLAFILFIGLVGVLNANFYFWIIFTLLHIVACFVLTFQIYYMGKLKLDWGIFRRACHELGSRPMAAITPTYRGRCVLLWLANIVNWAIAAYGAVQHKRDFGSHLLLVLMSNLFLYTMFYIVMKLLHKESIRWYTWVFIALTYGTWFGSSYFYFDQSTNWDLTPAQSRRSNRECFLFQLYDSHDIWHFLSSIAMFFSFNMYLTIDDNLSKRPRSDIMAF